MKKNTKKSGGDRAKVFFVVKILLGALCTLFLTSILFALITDDLEQPPLPLNTNSQTIRNRNQELYEEYSRKHVLLKTKTAVTCAAENMQLLRGDILPENHKYDMILMLKQEPQYYSLCLGDDAHQQTVEFSLEYGQCDILVSASGALPRRDFWDWKLNSRLSRRTLAIHTYAPEILRSNDKSLHIGVISSNSGGACKVGIKITPFNDEELLPKLGLRGGQVMLKRDLVH
mmetsp:Transcript_819/g.1413  ORF Transcript_819/g.1413 Transcript_819/m.1413 type:complete len:230 (-) Transcript_819:139-828(-)